MFDEPIVRTMNEIKNLYYIIKSGEMCIDYGKTPYRKHLAYSKRDNRYCVFDEEFGEENGPYVIDNCIILFNKFEDALKSFDGATGEAK